MLQMKWRMKPLKKCSRCISQFDNSILYIITDNISYRLRHVAYKITKKNVE